MAFSLETILYQNKDSVLPKLEEVVTEIKHELEKKVYVDIHTFYEKTNLDKKLIKIINDRFGLNIVVERTLSGLYEAAIVTFFNDHLNKYKPMISEFSSMTLKSMLNYKTILKSINTIEKERKKILKDIENMEGVIDLKNARVSGYFSKVKHYLLFDFKRLFQDYELTSSEVVAILLHEVGHAFHGLENHYKVEKMNVAILQVLKEINNNDIEKAEYVFKSHFNNYEEFKNYIALPSRKRTDLENSLAFIYMRNVNTQLIDERYDETSTEQLADEFVSRFGYGKHVVTALNKIVIDTRVLRRLQAIEIAMLTFIWIFAFIFSPITTTFGLMLLILFIYGYDYHLTYDYTVDRYNRIKNSIVNNLKNTRLPKSIQQDLLEQYNTISTIMENNENFKPLIHEVKQFLFERKSVYYMNLQKNIENNLNNALFVKSVQVSLT